MLEWAIAHLAWEGLQLPLHTLWKSATQWELLSLYFIAPSAT